MTEAAIRGVYEEFRAPLFRFGYRLTGSADLAEDLVHDCFVGLFRGGFDERQGTLKTYLYASVRNLACKHRRDFGREELTGDAGAGDARERSAPGAALDMLITRETSAAVQAAVEALPSLQREVLVLFEYEDLSLDDVAGIVGAEVGAVKSRLYRARENLRKSLAPALRETTR